jgi:DNA-binding CsgD family transcriptional regulator
MTTAIGAQTFLSLDDFRTGRWDAAVEQAREVISWCEQHRYLLHAWPARFILAAVAAGRGDRATVRTITDDMLHWAGPRRIQLIQCLAWEARSFAASGNGEFEEAYRCAARISRPGQLASHVPSALYVALDLVEACMRTNRQAEAAAHVAAMEAAGLERISSRLRLIVNGCAAIAADDAGAAIDRFSAALAIPDAERWPFQLARIQLLYGERLRRAGATGEARQQLYRALERFQWLGARPWTARAQDELRATGETSLPADSSDAGRLTPRERQIAALAASGLRNKEIADRLVLSERTVAAHLHRAFPKLGVTSRAGLRDALDLLPLGRPEAAAGPAVALFNWNAVILLTLSGPVICHASRHDPPAQVAAKCCPDPRGIRRCRLLVRFRSVAGGQGLVGHPRPVPADLLLRRCGSRMERRRDARPRRPARRALLGRRGGHRCLRASQGARRRLHRQRPRQPAVTR